MILWLPKVFNFRQDKREWYGHQLKLGGHKKIASRVTSNLTTLILFYVLSFMSFPLNNTEENNFGGII